MPSTTHWAPKARAPALMSPGSRTAGLLIETFSAPASSTSRMASTERIPPPTAKGMKIASATRRTASTNSPRFSAEAVMS